MSKFFENIRHHDGNFWICDGKTGQYLHFKNIWQLKISHILKFNGFEQKFRNLVESTVVMESLGPYSLKIYEMSNRQSVDTTAFLTFANTKDNMRIIQVLDNRPFGQNQHINKYLCKFIINISN